MDLEKDIYLVVQDANIIIDLHNAGLLSVWFELGIPTLTTDMVELELQQGDQWCFIEEHIQEERIEVIGFSAIELREIQSLNNKYTVSIPDCSVLYLTEKRNARLITGDKRLRKVAEHNGIQCHGVLWVIDILFEKKVIDGLVATAALGKIISFGGRLPEKEVNSRYKLWDV
jgi:predicted nucleic acid-binding protein